LGVVVMTLIALPAAAQQSGLQISVAERAADAGATVQVPVSIMATGAQPTTLTFFIQYNPLLLTFNEAATTLAPGLSFKDLAHTPTSQPGGHGFTVSGGFEEIPDGAVVLVAFDVAAQATAQTLAVELTDASAADVNADDFVNIALIDGAISIGCVPSAAPTPTASQDRSDGVLVEWESVTGASEYRVYRSTSDAVGGATPIGDWQTATSFLDTTAAPPSAGSSMGCGNPQVITEYHYWVLSRTLIGCVSEFGDSAMGYRSAAKVMAKALPALSAEGVGHAVADQSLAVRLLLSEAVDPDSVWATVDAAEACLWEVQWQPSSSAGDGWVVVAPLTTWPVGTVVTVSAGATTLSGTPVAPSTGQWVIEGDEDGALLWQPDFIDFTAIPYHVGAEKGLSVSIFECQGDAPPLPGGLGRVFRIAPQTPFATPQRVWLPVPAGISLADVQVYYLDGGEWLAGVDVAGWLASEHLEETTQAGQRMAGLLVNHGGTVQLSTASGGVRPASAGAAADMLLILLAAGMLAWRAGRPRPAQESGR
jgi:hypothetical protein